MKYYKVKPEADNKKRLDGDIYVANELYTPAEAKRYNLNMDYVDAVEVSKRRVYWFFGARFEAVNE